MEEDTKNHSSNRGKGRGRGRGRKKIAESDTKVQEPTIINDGQIHEPEALTFDLDADITQLEAPTFSTINKGPPEPMLRLKWDHKTHLIGEKVRNPMIHVCDKCEAPILIYGRMIPCKHVFCISCAEKENTLCPRCQEKVVRIEKTGLGTVFMCTFGGTRYENIGCRRTYLSQRDLQAHINHRHVSCNTTAIKEGVNNSQVSSNVKTIPTTTCRTKPSVSYHIAASGDPRVQNSNSSEYFHKLHHSPSSHTSSSSQQSRQSLHHTNISHQTDQQPSVQGGSVSHQQFSSLSSSASQRHVPVSNTQPKLPPSTDFVNQMMMSTYLQTNPINLSCSTNVNNSLLPMQMLDSSLDSNNSAMNLSRSANFHQNFSPQFSQTSSPGIPFPVPPPGQAAMSPIPQTQYFSPYPTTPQRTTVPHFSPNSPAQSFITQPQIISTNPSTTRRPQYPGEGVIQPFPVPPPTHRWPQPSQSNQSDYY